jgi:hypothetical protein
MQPVSHIRLICRDLPWTIDIQAQVVVCGLIWERVHAELRRRMTDAEWALVCKDGCKRRTVEKTMKRRLEEFPSDDPMPLRIDYLGETTMFKGLEKDDAYAEKILMPGREKCETWAIRLGRR